MVGKDREYIDSVCLYMKDCHVVDRNENNHFQIIFLNSLLIYYLESFLNFDLICPERLKIAWNVRRAVAVEPRKTTKESGPRPPRLSYNFNIRCET